MSNKSVFRVRIGRKHAETAEIFSFELVPMDAESLPPFSAGSHIDVHVNGFVRQYSLCNHPEEQHRYQIAVLRDPKSRGGSIAMHDLLNVGDVVEISEPKNHFALANNGNKSILIAGGIGVTPILCMAERLANIGASFEFHYCARSSGHAAFRDRIAHSSFAHQAHFHFDDAGPEERLDIGAILADGVAETDLYVCGPGGFIDFVVAAAAEHGVPSERIHFERFGAIVVENDNDQPFVIKIASSGQSFSVPPEKSITTVLSENGIEVPLSCEQGVCGTCITRVLGGMPDHRDQYFSDEEKALNDQFTPCCSRSKSAELILDL
jgi:vanillate O-demethylase ferredoxin subunit